MSMLQEFFVFLADLFQESGGQLDPATIKQRMTEEGFEDVTAYDVQEAVALMYEEGDVFDSDQSSVLDAYTGGNFVDQSFNGTNIGVATSGNAGGAVTAASTHAGSHGGSHGGATGGAPAPAYTQPPPPPPMDPAEGYTNLDAAVQQIVYVSNITNNTTINDQDTFEDNDTVVDSSVNQTILAGGDVTQDFDTTVAGQEGIAVGADSAVVDSNLVTGDNEGVIADDIRDTNLVQGDAEGIVGNANVGAVVGDNNDTQTLINSDGNATGDGSSITNTTNTTLIAGDNISGDGSNVTVIDGDNTGVVGTGGDVEAINNSVVGQAGFGSGDVENTVVSDNTIDESNFQIGDDNEGEVTSDDTFDTTFDASIDIVDVDNSAVLGSDIGITDVDGPIEVEPAPEPAMDEAETAGA